MITVFPTLQPEELLYSACARYRELFRYPGDRSVARELFGTHQATAIVELPLSLDAFVARLPPGQPYTVEDLVAKHTTLPYYSHFLAPPRLERIMTRMREGRSGPVPGTLLGTGRGKVLRPGHLHYCTACAEEDVRRAGEPCWRRVHQLPGVLVCPDHGIPLCRGPVRRKELVRVFAYDSLAATLAEDTVPLALPSCAPARLKWLADGSLRLLQMRPLTLTPTELRARHRGHLRTLGGLLSVRGKLDVRGTEKLLVCHWGDALLEHLGLHPDSEQRLTSWVRARVAGNYGGHPLLHLLLIGMCGVSIDQFFDREGEAPFQPTGSLPECANPACPHYLPRDRRNAARRAYQREGRPWECRKCGARYEEFSAHRGVRFLETGPLWDAEFRRLVESDTPVQVLQAWCSMIYPLMLCHASRIGAWRTAWGDPTKHSLADVQAREQELRDKRRAEWLRIRRAEPSASRTVLNTQSASLWKWLRDHDMMWLIAHSPASLRARWLDRTIRIDWAERDQVLFLGIEEAVLRLRQIEPPVRLTIASIGREADARVLIVRQAKRLPLAAAAVRAAVETVKAFTVRRIAWQAAEHVRRGEIPVYSDFLERCGIEWAHQNRFADALQKGLKEIYQALLPEAPHLELATEMRPQA